MKMTSPVIIENISWCTDKKRVKDLKNFSGSIQWKTQVESVNETVIEINETLSALEAKKAFGQPLGKNTIAAGIHFEDFCRS